MVNSDNKEEESNDNNKEEDIGGYTASERAYLRHIDNLRAASDVDNNNNIGDGGGEGGNEGEGEGEVEEGEEGKEEEEKDERYYLREEIALKRVEIITKLRLHIKEA